MAKKEDFRILTIEEQIQKRNQLLEDLRKHRFSSVMGKVDNPMRSRLLRRAVARLNTLIHEKKRVAV
ncbi:MAG: 50S ribosomal protein L29 [Spirochaetia bacterium]